MVHMITNCDPRVLIIALFPDSPHVAYIVLTFELARAKSACKFKGQYYIRYIRGGESGNEAILIIGCCDDCMQCERV